jgi:hypothetical protein
MTPIERAARAMCDARREDGLPILNADPDFGEYPLTRAGTDDLCPFTEDDVLTLVRAIIEAIREPSEQMTAKVEFHELTYSRGGEDSFDYLSADNAADVWRKMVDAMLGSTGADVAEPRKPAPYSPYDENGRFVP